MKLIPILFSSAMVQALLAGTKTQTRRLVKPQPTPEPARFAYYGETGLALSDWVPESNSGKVGIFEPAKYKCRYGKPGDVLWVRETFVYRDKHDKYYYKADAETAGCEPYCHDGWKPSLHMPYAACRIWLQVKSVRVERLQDISEVDAWAEGCKQGEPTDNGGFFPADEPDPSGIGERGWDCAKDWYADLWEEINGPGSWETNPWVWVVEFERIEKPQSNQ